jgi:hypothetical protein
MKLGRWFWRIVVLSTVVGIVWTAWAATWVGFWGGQSRYPGTTPFEKGKWTSSPVCYQFLDTAEKRWTETEKKAARLAIAEWGTSLGAGKLKESSDPKCADIVLLWTTDRLFKNFGDPNGDKKPVYLEDTPAIYIPIQVAPPIGWEPCPDLKMVGVLDRCSMIAFNLKNSWFVDSTPEADEEFDMHSVTRCGKPMMKLVAKPRGPADGKQDFYTIVAHEFGHALGLVHSGGCDTDPTKPRPPDSQDDDGRVMWEGFIEDRREASSEEAKTLLGQSERRHVTNPDQQDLVALYPPDGGEPDLPDLAVTSLSIRQRVHPMGCDMTVTALIRNIGKGDAGSFAVQISVDGSSDEIGILQSLKAGQAEPVVAFFAVSFGIHFVEILVDAKDQIKESNEQNNRTSGSATCAAG